MWDSDHVGTKTVMFTRQLGEHSGEKDKLLSTCNLWSNCGGNKAQPIFQCDVIVGNGTDSFMA